MTQPTRVVSSAKQRRAGTGKQRAKRQPRGTAIERQLARRRNRIAGPIHQSARGQAGRAAMHRDIVGKVLAGWMTIRGQAGRAAMHRDCQTAVPLLRFLYCGSFTAGASSAGLQHAVFARHSQDFGDQKGARRVAIRVARRVAIRVARRVAIRVAIRVAQKSGRGALWSGALAALIAQPPRYRSLEPDLTSPDMHRSAANLDARYNAARHADVREHFARPANVIPLLNRKLRIR